jgi:THO complex subunit 4
VRGRGAGRGGRGRGRGGAPAEDKSVEDLDADLESYHAEAMQTN